MELIEFEAGTIAASSDVNDNFQTLADVLGNDSTADRVQLPSDVVLGPRSNVQLTANSDTEEDETKSFLQLNWNAESYYAGSWKHRRFTSGEPATSVRVGLDGFTVWTTSATSGGLTSQLDKVFQIHATTANDFIYMKPSITRVAEAPDSMEDYRNTIVIFDTPKTIYEDSTIYASNNSRDATQYGVPAAARGVLLMFEGLAVSNDAQILFTKSQATRHKKYGFYVNSVAGKQNSGQGIVALGETGAYTSCFTEERSSQWNSATLYIQGYLY